MYKIKNFVFVFSGMLKEFGGILELIENWSQSVLKSINWAKRKVQLETGTTGKVELSKKFLEEEKLTF